MKFKIFNRFSGRVQFTAEIDDSENSKINIGLAIAWGIKNDADFSSADFSGADFSGADFSGADFSGANLNGADFSGADFSGANFSGANLNGADFSSANLSRAGVIHLQLGKWGVYVTKTHINIGCHFLEIDRWLALLPGEINSMNCEAIEWSERYRDIVLTAVELVKNEK